MWPERVRGRGEADRTVGGTCKRVLEGRTGSLWAWPWRGKRGGGEGRQTCQKKQVHQGEEGQCKAEAGTPGRPSRASCGDDSPGRVSCSHTQPAGCRMRGWARSHWPGSSSTQGSGSDFLTQINTCRVPSPPATVVSTVMILGLARFPLHIPHRVPDKGLPCCEGSRHVEDKPRAGKQGNSVRSHEVSSFLNFLKRICDTPLRKSYFVILNFHGHPVPHLTQV